MGQSFSLGDNNNSFRKAIINGLIECGVKFSNKKNYPYLNYGLIIRPLNLDYNFREPIRYFFNGYPYHVGIIKNDIIYSFCPDLREPHRGTLHKDIIEEHLSEWSDGEIFWFIHSENSNYLEIGSRLIDLMQVKYGLLDLKEFNRRYSVRSTEPPSLREGYSLQGRARSGLCPEYSTQSKARLEQDTRRVNLKMNYNLLSNNCTDVALTVLIGQTRCFQIESIVDIIMNISKIKEVMDLIPDYGKIWLNDFKYIKNK